LNWIKEMVILLRTQRGITLIEVLVTLAILSFIGITVWNVFFQGYNFSQKSITKNTIQQEANLVITNLTNIHQTSKQYEIQSAACQITVNITNNDNSTKTMVFNDSRFCYSTLNTGLINPKLTSNRLMLTVSVSDRKVTSNKVDINTTLYRLKDGGV
ncbi:prepilin-type N-terminal cleavage/methylation domain-containing protein, partial [Neobacillus niacini]|uniref:PulJ/GspJ family protein n=1 Tax=Neobacillus niacini TaxID=86668 RepID=UPI0030033386